MQEEIEILGSQIANFATTGGSIAAVDNPFIDQVQVPQQMDGFGMMNTNYYQNELVSELPYQSFDNVQNDNTTAQMISPLFCLGEEDGVFEFCNSNNVVESSAFDVSVEENCIGYPWIVG